MNSSLNGGSNVPTLFLYNIGENTQEDDIWKLVAPFGAISKVDMMFDKDTNKGKGFCFVKMRNYDDCTEAIRKLNGVYHDLNPDKPLQVRFKKDDQGGNNMSSNKMESYDRFSGFQDSPYSRNAFEPYQARGGMGGGMGGGMRGGMGGGMGAPFSEDGGYKLFVYNIGEEAVDTDLLKVFAPFGAVIKADVIFNKETNKGKGFGFVTMKNYNDAQRAIDMLNGTKHKAFNANKPLQVRFKDDDTKNANSGGSFSDMDMYRPAAPKKMPSSVMSEYYGSYYDSYANPESLRSATSKSASSGLMDDFYGTGYNSGGFNSGGFNSYSRDSDFGSSGPVRNGRSSAVQNRFNPMAKRELPAVDTTGLEANIVFIYNINPNADEAFLCTLFSSFGPVAKADVIRHNTGEGKGFGFVTMRNYDDAAEAIKSLNGVRHESNPGKAFQVKFKTSKE